MSYEIIDPKVVLALDNANAHITRNIRRLELRSFAIFMDAPRGIKVTLMLTNGQLVESALMAATQDWVVVKDASSTFGWKKYYRHEVADFEWPVW